MFEEAQALETQLAVLDTRHFQLLHGALQVDPELPEAHVALAARYRAEHEQAERAGRAAEAASAEALLRQHVEQLPVAHETRVETLAYLRGDGTLTLHTEPAGAAVRLRKLDRVHGRLLPGPPRDLGETPLDGVPCRWGATCARSSTRTTWP